MSEAAEHHPSVPSTPPASPPGTASCPLPPNRNHSVPLPQQRPPTSSQNVSAGLGPPGVEGTDRVTLRPCCFNCWTTESSTWRRSKLSVGKIVCTECGLFERKVKHSRPRPVQFPHVPLPPELRHEEK